MNQLTQSKLTKASMVFWGFIYVLIGLEVVAYAAGLGPEYVVAAALGSVVGWALWSGVTALALHVLSKIARWVMK